MFCLVVPLATSWVHAVNPPETQDMLCKTVGTFDGLQIILQILHNLTPCLPAIIDSSSDLQVHTVLQILLPIARIRSPSATFRALPWCRFLPMPMTSSLPAPRTPGNCMTITPSHDHASYNALICKPHTLPFSSLLSCPSHCAILKSTACTPLNTAYPTSTQIPSVRSGMKPPKILDR